MLFFFTIVLGCMLAIYSPSRWVILAVFLIYAICELGRIAASKTTGRR